ARPSLTGLSRLTRSDLAGVDTARRGPPSLKLWRGDARLRRGSGGRGHPPSRLRNGTTVLTQILWN
ncbi:MAG TPA: hypothetical protein VJ044_13420, partial [Candidatus Hodarchaeales archaeon]|nr:hypothetical protein [Candidatus Hodarchaeales archaeon]